MTKTSNRAEKIDVDYASDAKKQLTDAVAALCLVCADLTEAVKKNEIQIKVRNRN